MAHQHNLGRMAPDDFGLAFTILKVIPEIKTTSPAGAKKCIDSSYSNSFSRLL
jgi:hypothetical protein